MGVGRKDRFVVITEAGTFMHGTCSGVIRSARLARAREGPAEAHGGDTRCASVTRRARFSLSEQSVNVRGYATFHVKKPAD